ncbi:MAG: 3-dehydroquinate dehydratase [Alphaproteobacteria bacterium MarineAlpha9_Bin4]|nr:type II 3-dehydroquinate dehydratase [Pelagibacterales bacterium]PPR26861.1 MAG: 3-dehydroquinate dehydratase [Alphaproteobacteria bacterium MarineAlpha9_Bin4]|tara:strand:- start:193 stop:654 length:462 start_codon:yes stop_codon:yes gene_type:complete
MTNKKILIINGPNLNLLGKRESKIYGLNSLKDLERNMKAYSKKKKAKVSFFQSNSEGEIIDFIQKNIEKYSAIIINAGAYSHTSLAICDCLRIFQGLIYEVHISNIYNREKYRRYSYLSDISSVVICGLGFLGYEVAIDLALVNHKSIKDGYV